MKKIILPFLACLYVTFLSAQTPFSSVFIGNGNLTGATQTPLYLGNWSSATSTPSTVASYTLSTQDAAGSGIMDIHATRWGGTVNISRDDPNGNTKLMSISGYSPYGAGLTVYNGSNQPGVFLSGAGNSYFIGGGLSVGTTSLPSGYNLAVNGAAIITKVVVKTYPWSDYVFNPAYHLTSLDSVERYIQEHGHLSDVPTADSVARYGIELGGNQAVLLKKIEELTLYAIGQEKLAKQQALMLLEH
jgi:hypothetical protein